MGAVLYEQNSTDTDSSLTSVDTTITPINNLSITQK